MEKVYVPHQVYLGPEIQVPAYLRDYHHNTPLYSLEERFYVRSKFLGSVWQEWHYTNDNRLSQLRSTAFFCPECGDLWARRVVCPYWRVDSRLCERHGGGSLLFEGEADVLESNFPLSLIIYEFVLSTKEL